MNESPSTVEKNTEQLKGSKLILYVTLINFSLIENLNSNHFEELEEPLNFSIL